MRGTIAAFLGVAAVASVASAAPYTYTQDFDGMGTAGTAAPAGWSVLTIAGASTVLTPPMSSDMLNAVAGSTTLSLWNQTSNAAAWGSAAGNVGSSATDTNRLLGTSPTGTMGSMLQLDLTNTSGDPVTSVSLAYDMKAMKNGTLKSGRTETAEELPGYRIYYLDGSTWTRVPGLDLANDTLNSIGHASAIIGFTTPVANGGSMKFRWYDDNGDPSSPDFMVAIDNVSVSVPEPTVVGILAAGSLFALRRKRSK